MIDSDRRPFQCNKTRKKRRNKAEKVRFDRLYNRIQSLIKEDSSLETETLTVKELAAVLGINPSTLRKWIMKGIIVPRRTATGRIYFRKEDFSSELFQPHAVYSVRETAKIIKRTIRFVYKLLKTGELSARKYGHRWFIGRDDLQEYFDTSVGPI